MTRQNVTFSVGSIAVIDKIDSVTGFFQGVFGGLAGRAKTFIPSVKLLVANKLGQSMPVSRILDFTPLELLELLGFDDVPSERSVYRTLERLGERHQIILRKYQEWVEAQKLVDETQLVDFSSSYFEGRECPLGRLGYSRDGQPGKRQFTFGVSVGMNGIPAMLTVQKGNVQDKVHMRSMIRLCSMVLPVNSLLVFDCGGNTKENKARIRKHGFHYLTFKAKKKTPYGKALLRFAEAKPGDMKFSERSYLSIKYEEDGEFLYVFFSEDLKKYQVRKKTEKFRKAMEKGEVMQKKVRKGKDLGQQVCPDGWIMLRGQLQKTIAEVQNPFITGLEGFFILESSLDESPAKILEAYKNRDKAEKFIRDLKEGAELRPVRHWSKTAVIGFVLLVFLTKTLITLTQLLSKNPLVKNLKLLKKYLNNLTLTVLYPENSFKLAVICNFSPEIQALLGDSVKKYGCLKPKLGW